MAKRSSKSRARRRPLTNQARRDAAQARIMEAEATRAERELSTGAGTDQTNQVEQTRSVTIPIPTVEFVHYADRSYFHVNGLPTVNRYSPNDALMLQRAFEAVEATGAIRIVEQDLRHLSVIG